MKSKTFHTVGTVPNFNWKIAERGKIDSKNAHIYDLSLSYIGTRTSIKNGIVRLASWAQKSICNFILL